MSARCVPPRGAAQHQPRGCAAHSSSSVRTTRLIIRLLLRFELPGWYLGTTRLIIRLVVQLIIRLVVNYQLQADNPADNPAVSFVVILAEFASVRWNGLGQLKVPPQSSLSYFIDI